MIIMLQFLSIILSSILFFYLIYCKRKIDVFLVSGFSLILFFLPVFSGVLHSSHGYPDQKVVPIVYLTMILMCISIFISAFIYDNTIGKSTSFDTIYDIGHLRRVSILLFLVWLLLLYLNIDKYGVLLFTGLSKRDLMDTGGRGLFLFVQLSSISALTLILCKGAVRTTIGSIIIFLMVVVGHRSPVALVGLALLLLLGREGGRVSLVRRYPLRLFVFLFLPIMSLSILKPIYANFKAGGFNQVVRFFSNNNFADAFCRGAEFLNTQYIFNEIVRSDFTTDGGHFFRSPLSLLPVPRSLYTTPSSEFNDLFQPELFPDVISGMANNPFAEIYSFSGLWGLVVLSISYSSFIFLLNYLIMKSRYSLFPVISLCVVLIAFYFHRNSFAVSFGFIRIFIYPYLGLWILIVLFSIFMRCVLPRRG